jgi:hypothetical protein
MHSSSPIVCGLARMAVVAATQYQERENLERLNLRRLEESQNDESEGEDDDDMEWESNITLN